MNLEINSVYIYFIKAIHKFKIIFLDLFSFIKNKKQILLIENLRKNIKSLPQLSLDGITNESWTKYRINVRVKMQNCNLGNFLNWGIVRSSMFHECSRVEYLKLRGLDNYDIWKNALVESKIGNPRPYPDFLSSSGNLIHNAYSLSELLLKHNIDIKSLNKVFEFGGGYGSMCRLFLNLGFNGQYIIYDLPEFNYLQEYFLKSSYVNKNISVINDSTKKQNDGVVLISNKDVLASQFNDSSVSIDIFLATWSISEAPIEVRELVFDTVKNPKYYLIAYRDCFEGVDNKLYFNDFCNKHSDYLWNLQEIDHLPGNFYLIGKRIFG